MTKKPLRINYDQTGDVLYILFENNVSSYGEDIAEGVVGMYSFETDELTGITIDFYSRRKRANMLDIPFIESKSHTELQRTLDTIH